MNEVLTAFGIDWRLIVIQVFNFALLMGVLWYFLYTPVLNIIKERKEKIEKGVQDAKDAATLKEHAEEDRMKVLTDANTEAEEIVARATAHAKEKTVELLSSAKEKATIELERAAQKGEELMKQKQKESEAEIAKAAILVAEKILKGRS